MCGRYTLTSPATTLAASFDIGTIAELAPRYNVAPSQSVPVVRMAATGTREWVEVRWGLIPSWAKDPAIGQRLINARAETAAAKPAFRAAMRRRRCLVPADGFYEWQKRAQGKQPFYIRRRDDAPFAIAGLWEHWQPAGGELIETCTLLTTEPNSLVAPIHNRMPVIVDQAVYAQWLDPTIEKADDLAAILQPYPDNEMVAIPISTRVNNARHDAPDCIEPLMTA